MSFNLSNIVNNFLNVRNKVKDVDGNWVDQKKPKESQNMASAVGRDISSGVTINIFEVWDKRIIIDTLEFGTDTTAYAQLHIERDASGSYTNQLFHETRRGGGRANSVPAIVGGGSSFFDVESVDDDAKVWLRRPVILPKGGKLSFSATSDTGGTLTYKVYWREIEE